MRAVRRRGIAVGLGLCAASIAAAQTQRPDPIAEGVYFKTDFPAEEFTARRAKVLEGIGDAVAFVQGAPPVRGFAPVRQSNEFYYLTGIEVPRAYLILDGRSDESILFLPERDRRAESAEGRELSPDDEALIRRINGVDRVLGPQAIAERLGGAAIVYTPFSPAEGITGSRDELRRADRLVAADPWDGAPTREQHLRNLIAERVPNAEIRDLSPILDGLRAIKSENEIRLLRRAGQLSALGLNEAIESTRPGLIESQLDAAARYVFYVNGAQFEGYRSITASGENIINMHYFRNNAALGEDDVVLMDYSPDVGYYTSDIGRMWPVDGTYPPYMRELYGFVVEYHKVVLSVLRPGVTTQQLRGEIQRLIAPTLEGWEFSKPIYRAAAERLVERGGGDFSHSVGMAVHDVGRRGRVLAPGMVFSIDPQLRVPEEGLYIRTEDTIVITGDGHENFTALAPLELDDVEAMMRERGVIDLVPPVPPPDPPGVAAPPAHLNADPWYGKHYSAHGLPILSSPKVADEALVEASHLINQMLAARPDVRQTMIDRGVRVVVMAPDEMTTDVPEQRDMEPKEYWDRRARGLGGRLTSCGEENLLNLQGDRYRGENILIHEFSHCIAGQGLRRLHPDFNDRLRALYEDAKAKGLWARTYAMENPAEYWAEAVQSWFDCNRQSRRGEEPDGVHNHVDTREELIEYDPGVAALIEEMLGRSEWRYSTYLERHPEAAGDR